MKNIFALALLILAAARDGYLFSVQLEKLSTLYLPYDYTPTPQYAVDEGATEQITYDAKGRLIYSVGKNYPGDIKLFSCSSLLSMKFKLQISTEIANSLEA